MITNFPNGVSSFGIPLIGSGPILTTGDVFFVSSTRGSDGNDGKSPDRPWSTVDYGIGRTVASRGDTLVVMPNHAETSTNTAGFWAFDIAGITAIGIGHYNQRPRLLLDAGTVASITVSAADVRIKNFEIASGTADTVNAIDVTAVGCWLDEIEFNDNVADENFLIAVDAAGTTDEEVAGLKLTNCRFITADALVQQYVRLAADVTNFVFSGNLFVSEGAGSEPPIECATGKDLKRCIVTWNYIIHKNTSGNLFITNDTASPNNSGVIAHNRVGHGDVTGAHVLGVVGGARMFDNLSVSTDALSGFVIPAIDVDL